MNSQHLLTISDVGIAVNCDVFFTQTNTEVSNAGIFALSPSTADLEVGATINLSSESVPPHPGKKIVGDGQLWRFYLHGNGFLDCRYFHDQPNQPVWWALIDQQFRNIDIGVNIEALRPSAEGEIQLGRPEQFAADINLLIPVLLNHAALVFHAAGGIFQHKGFVFPGSSGTGKSTLTKLLIKKGHHMLSDERMIVKKRGDTWHTYGTPWPGDAGISDDASAPLASILFLKQAETNHLQKLSTGESLKRLLSVCSIPWHLPSFTDKALALATGLVADIPMYELACTPDHHPVEAIENLASSF